MLVPVEVSDVSPGRTEVVPRLFRPLQKLQGAFFMPPKEERMYKNGNLRRAAGQRPDRAGHGRGDDPRADQQRQGDVLHRL